MLPKEGGSSDMHYDGLSPEATKPGDSSFEFSLLDFSVMNKSLEAFQELHRWWFVRLLGCAL